MKHLVPLAVETATLLVREAVVAYGRREIADKIGPSLRNPAGDRPKAEGCPYCATAKALAIAHMYLVRHATVAPPLQAIYHDLAKHAVNDALAALDSIRVRPDRETMALTAEVSKIAGMVEAPIAAATVEGIANTVWRTVGLALRLAERFNAEPDAADDVLRTVDDALGKVTGEIIIDERGRVIS